MKTQAVLSWWVERVAEAPPAVVFLGRLTACLALAWIVHAALAGRNPRWRVGLWRATVAGLAIIAALSALPPVVTWRVPRATVAPVVAAPTVEPVRDAVRTPVSTSPLPAVSSPSAAPNAAIAVGPAPTPAPSASTRPRVAGSPPSRRERPVTLESVLLAAWLAGMVVLAVRLLLAAVRLARVIRRAGDVPGGVIDESNRIAGRLGVAPGIRVACSAEVATPCLAGLFRPVLLLPDSSFPDPERADVRAILAHELAHAHGRDLAWNNVWHVASVVLWFHPLIWKARAAHAAACDSVCDAIAADLLGDVDAYVRTLARLALHAAGPRPVHGLTMARGAEVSRRIASLRRRVFRSPLSGWCAIPALLSLVVVVVAIGGAGFAQDDGPTTAAPVPAKSRIAVRVAAARTGEALNGASITYRVWYDGKFHDGKVATSGEGTAVVEWPQGAKVSSLTLKVSKPRYVTACVAWDDEKQPITLPEREELRLEPGTTAGGVVKDDVGRPVAGATVSLTARGTQPERPSSVFELAKTRTDDQGRWRVDEVPENLGMVTLFVEHPRYRQRSGAQIEGRDSLVVLKRGLAVKGRVVDRAGSPVKTARVVIAGPVSRSNPPAGTSDGRGEYTVEGCDPGPSHVTVQARGFGPELREVEVAPEGETTMPDVRLEPGEVLRVRVVDRAGNPVVGAYVAADTWRGRQEMEFRGRADAEGFVTWNDAPRDAVMFDIFLDGYMRRRLLPLLASNEAHVVTLDPELVVSGRVTDAATGRPIPRLQVVQGREQYTGSPGKLWSTSLPAEASGGTYSTRFDFPMRAHFVRVEAPGYKTAESRAFRSDEGRQTLDFALEREAGLSGLVVGPDGKPAGGVAVAVASSEHHVSLSGGILDRDSQAPRTVTGPDGRFEFPAQGNHFTFIAVGDAGYADGSADEFAKSGKLVLEPWGRLEGEVRIGRGPGSNQPVTFQPQRPGRRGVFVFSFGYSSGADAQGRFAFERVVPGPGIVSRNVVTDFGNGSQQVMPCWIKSALVQSNATTRVVVGGEGRPVVGRVVIDGTTEEPIDWQRNEPAALEPSRTGRGRDAEDLRRFASNLDRDGRFRIVDVTPGRYALAIPVNSQPDPGRCGSGGPIGRASLEVTVPAGSPDEPFDLGDVTARLLPTLKGRDLAPDFTVERLEGGRFSLGEQNGKLVLLDFWATWCAPCLADMPAMKDLQATFGGDPRFVLVGLSCDESVEAPRDYARENRLTWTQALAGSLNSGIAARYLVRSIPATFLVGPDGRILARNLRGPALKEAVRKALADGTTFTAAKSAVRPPRFPVTRLEALAGEPAPAPAVVVLDDCDGDFDEGRPHRDGLRFLADSGRELATFKDLNTCQSAGATHGVAIDSARGRVYVCELVSRRLTALDLRGRRLWRIDNIGADALAVDPRTGNLWCTTGPNLAEGETVVLDPEGKEVATFPVRGIDIAYDPHSDAFWLVGYGITKLSRSGETLFHKPHEGWACVTVAVDPGDGSVWIGERDHPDVARSANRLWHLDARGGVLHSVPLGKNDPFAVACDPRTGVAWVVYLRSEIARFARDGRQLAPIPIAADAIAVSPSRKDPWVTTRTEILRLDDEGKVMVRVPFGSDSGQSRLAAF